MIPDVYRYNLPMFYQPPYLDTMPNGTLCGLLAQSVPEGPDVIHNHKKINPDQNQNQTDPNVIH